MRATITGSKNYNRLRRFTGNHYGVLRVCRLMETLNEWIELLKAADIQLLKLGKTRITLYGLLWLLVLIWLLFFISGVAQRWLARRLLARTQLDIGTRESIAAIVRYLVLLIGLLII